MTGDYTTIRELAEEIAEKYNPQGFSPFPFDKVSLENDDLDIIEINTLGTEVSGVISYLADEDSFVILVNSLKPQVRKHFTLAHELGHYFLHKDIVKKEEFVVTGETDTNLFRLDNAVYSKIETEANIFAASLIMPKSLVYKAWEELKDVSKCANVFKVSVSAMSIRLEQLGLLD